jgi:hypothetical protein
VGNRIGPSEIKVVTQDGEVQITLRLDLNINLNTGGLLIEAAVDKPKAVIPPPFDSQEEEKTKWAIPEFGKMGKVKFGITEDESKEQE